MTLNGVLCGADCDFRSAINILLRDADNAFYDGDKDLCLDAIIKLYNLYDREIEPV